jgi:inorganic pyrophosphatase
VLDRELYSSVHYPCDYGFIDGSLADDGDPLDVLVVIAEPTFPGCVVRTRPVGVLDMADEKGHDFKILAVAHDDPRWDPTNRLEDLSPHRLLSHLQDAGEPTDRGAWLAGCRGRLAHHRLGHVGWRVRSDP